jgi:hypothetical protein
MTFAFESSSHTPDPVIDSLLVVRKLLDTRIQELDSLIEVRHREQIAEQYSHLDNLPTSVTLKKVGNTRPKLRSKPGVLGEVLSSPPTGSSLPVVGFSEGYWAVNYNGTIGYISDMFVVQSDDLNTRKILRRNSREELTQKIHDIRSEVEGQEIWVRVLKANVRSNPNVESEVIVEMGMGDRLFKRGDSSEWVNVLWLKVVNLEHLDVMQVSEADLYHSGWIHSSLISRDRISKPSRVQLRRIRYVQAHPNLTPTFLNAIQKGQVTLGMTKNMVTASIGSPKDVNRTVGSFGVHEQWVYGEITSNRLYVYFENGVLTSWQD